MSNTKKKASKTQSALDKFLKEKQETLKKADIKKILIMNIPYIITGYFVDKLSWLYRQADADLVAYKISHVVMNFTDAFTNPLPSIHPIDLFIGAVAGLILKGVISYIYPMLYRFGIIEVPEKTAEKMRLKGGLTNRIRDGKKL